MPKKNNKLTVIAGPCVAESYELLEKVARSLEPFMASEDIDFYFKASFDKANRSRLDSYRGAGLDTTLKWFSEIKRLFSCSILTDIHEIPQAEAAAEVCEGLQIPAFLCRQTDLLTAAVKTGRFVNIKKGQFMAPGAMGHIAQKAQEVAKEAGVPSHLSLTERGTTFGYGDLVVDMRGLKEMADTGVPVIYDVTHSIQRPPASSEQGVSKGLRSFAPLLARCAAASGYVSGFFMEVHRDPSRAQSDAHSQLTPKQGQELLRQLLQVVKEARQWSELDQQFS